MLPNSMNREETEDINRPFFAVLIFSVQGCSSVVGRTGALRWLSRTSLMACA